ATCCLSYYGSVDIHDRHSFPTRRSSDLPLLQLLRVRRPRDLVRRTVRDTHARERFRDQEPIPPLEPPGASRTRRHRHERHVRELSGDERAELHPLARPARPVRRQRERPARPEVPHELPQRGAPAPRARAPNRSEAPALQHAGDVLPILGAAHEPDVPLPPVSVREREEAAVPEDEDERPARLDERPKVFLAARLEADRTEERAQHEAARHARQPEACAPTPHPPSPSSSAAIPATRSAVLEAPFAERGCSDARTRASASSAASRSGWPGSSNGS